MGGGGSSSSAGAGECKVTYYDYPYATGRHDSLKLSKGENHKEIRNLGDWNDDIQSIVFTGSNCWIRTCEHTHFRGRCLEHNRPFQVAFPWGSQLSNTLSSIEIGRGSRGRRRGDASDESAEFDLNSMEEMKPQPESDALCNAMYEEMFSTDGKMLANSTIKHHEMEKLANLCDETYQESEEGDLCKFNIYAGAELLDDGHILETLEILDPEAETAQTELDHCHILSKEIYDGVEAGKLPGVEIQEIGGDAFYVLDSATAAGSMIAMIIGKPMIRAWRAMSA